MRIVVVPAVAALLAGCVQPVYVPPPPIELQAYPPPLSYQTAPIYRPPTLAPLAEPLPPPQPFPDQMPPDGTPPDGTASGDGTGAIPLQQMPSPASDAGIVTDIAPARTEPVPVVPRTPIAGPGSNVPLEGFRPMRGQTRPAP